MNGKKIKTLICLFCMLLVAVPAHADVVWPALFLEIRLLSLWPILIGLAVEYLFLRHYFKLDVKTSVKADIVINTASSALGTILIPLAGVAWELFPGGILYSILKMGTFNPATWTATYLMAVAINAAIESMALAKFYKRKVTKGSFCALSIANAISVGIAMITLAVNPLYM